MTFGELLGALLGWLGELVDWIITLVPRYEIVRFNQRAVRYHLGDEPDELGPGVRWYWPLTTDLEVHHVKPCLCALEIPPMSLETKDGVKLQVGMVVCYYVVDVVQYDAMNYDADENMAIVAQRGLRNVVTGNDKDWIMRPAEDGSRLEGVLARRMQDTLGRFGVEVESAAPTDQVTLGRGAYRIFGAEVHVGLDAGSWE